MQMDVVATTKRSVAVAGAAVVLVLLLLVAWIGGETHYRGCLERVALEHPVTHAQAPSSAETRARDDAIDDCSRWP